MPQLATKADLLAMERELLTEIRSGTAELRNEIRSSTTELCNNWSNVRSDFQNSFGELRHEIALVHNSLEIFELRLTIRLGVMMLLAMWAVVIIVKCV